MTRIIANICTLQCVAYLKGIRNPVLSIRSLNKLTQKSIAIQCITILQAFQYFSNGAQLKKKRNNVAYTPA